MKTSKEMKFLHHFCEFIEEEPSLDKLFSGLIRMLPSAFKHSNACSCSLSIHGERFGCTDDTHLKNDLREEIFTKGKKIGQLAILYNSHNNYFSPDEILLVKYISKRLGRIIERYEYEIRLRDILSDLEDNNLKLDMKNIALTEVLNQIKCNQLDNKTELANFINSNLLPNIYKLEEKVGQNFYLELLKINLEHLISDKEKIFYNFSTLSQRELECCFLIGKGFSSKEIAEKLLVSPSTISKHRANIRKKLGITGSNKNLFASLQIINQEK